MQWLIWIIALQHTKQFFIFFYLGISPGIVVDQKLLSLLSVQFRCGHCAALQLNNRLANNIL